MEKVSKIIAPTDLSELSSAAVGYALEMARARNAAVIVYYVVSEEGDWFGQDERLNPAAALIPQEKQRLHAFMRDQFSDLSSVSVTEIVEAGVPYSKIVEKAEQEHADLIVMSTHGRTGFEQIMLGSVTAKVLARAPCPVLSIRPPKTKR